MMFPGLRFIVGACGTKFGKTYGCATRIAKEAWDNAGSLNWWVAPSYGQAEMGMEEVKKRFPRAMYEPHDTKMRLDILNPDGSKHSVIQFKSAEDPDLLRGYPVNFFVIDEAARNIKYESFKSVMTTVTQTYGRGIIISTPNGRGWFYDLYQRGDKRQFATEWPEWYSLRMPTWVNPTVPLASIEDARKNLPEDAFRQEYMAEFLNESAGVFNNIKGCVRGTFENYVPGHFYVMGVDLAKTKDYTVLTVMDRNTKHVVAWQRFNQIDWATQYFQIISLARSYGHPCVCVDSTGLGDPIAETLRTAGLNVEPYKITGTTAKTQLIQNLRICIEQSRISYPHIPIMLGELERYEYKTTASGVTQYQAPEGFHDDCVISLALACWVAAQEPFVYRFYNARGV
jgi:hypothetical protein